MRTLVVLLACSLTLLPAAFAQPQEADPVPPGIVDDLGLQDAAAGEALSPYDPNGPFVSLDPAGILQDDPAAVAEPATLGQAIVGFLPGLVPVLAAGDSLAGFQVANVVADGGFLVVHANDVGEVRRAMADVPGVLYVEDDLPLSSRVLSNDPRLPSQYGPTQMKVDAAWGMAPGYGSPSVKVAVLDTGLRRSHEDFTPASRFLTGYNYVNGNANPNDDCGHGTHVIGTVAATTNNGKGVAGMSQATILPMRVLSAVGGLLTVQCTGSTSTVAQAIRDSADQGARIISMSIGGGASTTLESAVNYAWGKGAILVAAAGNDGSSNSIDYPGAYANVVAVGATNAAKGRASFSDMGPQLDVMAPGDAIWSTTYSSTTSYGTMSGTSMATPHVAGVLALALSCAPSATNSQAVAALKSTAEDLGAAGFDNTFGHGLARADLLVQDLCGGGGGTNQPPTASFTAGTTGLAVSTNGGASSDPDGSISSYAWSWGDGSPNGSGVTASHTYAAAGTYTVTLTVADDDGATASATQSVTVSSGGGGGGDPDPSTPNLSSGASQSVAVAANQEKFYKIQVPAGKSQLQVVMTGPSCGLLSCSLDADLYTRLDAKPTDALYDCRPYTQGNAETCTHANPAAGWWYVRVDGYSGSGTVTITATYS
ncbi:MAG TPA: S8 family serine peptidase [Candidatus Thermoplasmatota archaeon]|nr:S8 family serine peptidase [Candidatus Thermoplasmatota archaeon]